VNWLSTYAGLFVGSWALTGLVRRYTLRRLMDVPIERSSHDRPTPRGGGIAFVSIYLVFGAALLLIDAPQRAIWLALLGALPIAVIGWVDDHVGLSRILRLGVQIGAAIWAVAWLGGLSTLDTGLGTIRLGPAGSVLAVLGIVWSTNLFNFMDGIDGIAGTQTIVVAGAAGTLSVLSGSQAIAVPCFGLVACVAGFLVWNWPPAKIFMGDVGSAPLGFIIASLTLAGERNQGIPLLVWTILMGLFLVDATATLLRRILAGERWYEPHRSHAYQRAVQDGRSHLFVTSCALVVNLALAGVAAAALSYPHLRLAFLGGITLALFALWWRLTVATRFARMGS